MKIFIISKSVVLPVLIYLRKVQEYQVNKMCDHSSQYVVWTCMNALLSATEQCIHIKLLNV